MIALDAGRKDLQTIAAQPLAGTHIVRLELDEAELLLMRALELAGESGSVRARLSATLAYAWFLIVRGELDAAETVAEEVRSTAIELGIEPAAASALMKLGWIARARGDHKRPRRYCARRCGSRRHAETSACCPTSRRCSQPRSRISARSTRRSDSRSRRGSTPFPRTRPA